jgi:hypothetical protein
LILRGGTQPNRTRPRKLCVTDDRADDAVAHRTPSAVRKAMKRMHVRVADDLPYATSVILAPVHPSMAFSATIDSAEIVAPLGELLQRARTTLGQNRRLDDDREIGVPT